MDSAASFKCNGLGFGYLQPVYSVGENLIFKRKAEYTLRIKRFSNDVFNTT